MTRKGVESPGHQLDHRRCDARLNCPEVVEVPSQVEAGSLAGDGDLEGGPNLLLELPEEADVVVLVGPDEVAEDVVKGAAGNPGVEPIEAAAEGGDGEGGLPRVGEARGAGADAVLAEVVAKRANGAAPPGEAGRPLVGAPGAAPASSAPSPSSCSFPVAPPAPSSSGSPASCSCTARRCGAS